jgi:predicted Holliday junction resolvase-like endonuclease
LRGSSVTVRNKIINTYEFREKAGIYVVDQEESKQEKQVEKREERNRRKAERESRSVLLANGEDPDLAGIIPGPQHRRED